MSTQAASDDDFSNAIRVKCGCGATVMIFLNKAFCEYSHGLRHVPSWVSEHIVKPAFPEFKSFAVIQNNIEVCGSFRP